MSVYYRPLVQTDPARPDGALTLAGGWAWFSHVERLERGRPAQVIAASQTPQETLLRLTAPRAAMAGVTWDAPRLMGILNVTPDSFSDGGKFHDAGLALAQAARLAETCDILDIGGESTRPGAEVVPDETEIARTAPVIAALRAQGITRPVSIDTRKSAVAHAALQAGATIVNDVSAFSHDPALGGVVAAANAPVCLMHAQGTPQNMQVAPQYDDVLLDVYDYLAARIAVAEKAGIARSRIMVDPGIGFGKTLSHNLVLLQRISLFHALGCVVLLGASRKRFIGTIGQAPQADGRVAGSLAIAVHGAAQGVQVLRVHDSDESLQAMRLWAAVSSGCYVPEHRPSWET
jgi:dihydropteroate synthase